MSIAALFGCRGGVGFKSGGGSKCMAIVLGISKICQIRLKRFKKLCTHLRHHGFQEVNQVVDNLSNLGVHKEAQIYDN